jgi:hypothetical protein
MERVIFAEKFEIDSGLFNIQTPTLSIATQCNLEKHKKAVCSQKCQTEDILNNSSNIFSEKVAQVSEDKLQIELETIFSTSRKQMENKAELAAKIKHADWLRKGQTLEEAIIEYFKGE